MDAPEDACKDLSPASREVLEKVFLWAKRKRSLHLKDIEGEHAEYRALSLIDDSYNKHDVVDVLSGLLAIIKVAIEREHQENMQAHAEILRQVLLCADKAGATIETDIAALDNPGALGRMSAFEKGALERGSGFAPKASGLAPPKPGALAPLAPVEKVETPPPPPVAVNAASEHEMKLGEENRQLADDNRRLQDKLRTVQQQYTTMMQEKSRISQELSQLSELRTEIEKRDVALQDRDREIEKRDGEVAATQRELTGKLNDSTQFKNLKKMLAQKNQQLKTLRTKLEKYEPSQPDTIEVREESSEEDD